MAEIRQDLIRHIEYESSADQCYDNGVRYAVVANVGYWRIVTEYESEDSFDQVLKVVPIVNPFSVYFDSDIQTVDGSDAERCLVCEDLTKEEFHRRYPDASPIDWQSTDPALSAWIKADTIRIADYLHKVHYKDTLYLMADGSRVYGEDIEGDKPTRFDPEMQAMPGPNQYVDKREVDRCEVRWEVINGVEILEEHEWAGKYLPIIPVFGDMTNIEGEVIRQGLCERGVDSQQMYNYLITNAAEAAALQPKAPYIVAEGQIDQREREWGQANNKNLPYIQYRRYDETGKDLGVPQRSSPDIDVTGLLAQAGNFAQGMRQAIGIQDPLQMMEVQDQSGRALLAKQRITATGTFHFVDNLSRAIKLTGKVLLDLIPHIYDAPRTLQLLREDGSQYTQPVNVQQPAPPAPLGMNGLPDPRFPQMPAPPPDFHMGQGDYDVVVDVGPAYATKRAESADKIAQIAQSNPETWQVAGDLFVGALDLPNSEDLVERFRAMLPPQIQTIIAEKSKDPQVVAMAATMKQMQQQHEQEKQGFMAEYQKTKLENDQVKSQNAQLQVKNAMTELHAQQRDTTAQLKLQQEQIEAASDERIQASEMHDVHVHAALDVQKMELDERKTNLEANLKVLDALVNLYSKLGPQMGAQAEGQIAQQTPQMADVVSGKLDEMMKMMGEMQKPQKRTIVRGGDGNVVGIHDGRTFHQAVRGDDGSITGTEPM